MGIYLGEDLVKLDAPTFKLDTDKLNSWWNPNVFDEKIDKLNENMKFTHNVMQGNYSDLKSDVGLYGDLLEAVSDRVDEIQETDDDILRGVQYIWKVINGFEEISHHNEHQIEKKIDIIDKDFTDFKTDMFTYSEAAAMSDMKMKESIDEIEEEMKKINHWLIRINDKLESIQFYGGIGIAAIVIGVVLLIIL